MRVLVGVLALSVILPEAVVPWNTLQGGSVHPSNSTDKISAVDPRFNKISAVDPRWHIFQLSILDLTRFQLSILIDLTRFQLSILDLTRFQLSIQDFIYFGCRS